MNLKKLQEKFNERTKTKRSRKQEPPCILPRSYDGNGNSGRNITGMNGDRIKVGKMFGQK